MSVRWLSPTWAAPGGSYAEPVERRPEGLGRRLEPPGLVAERPRVEGIAAARTPSSRSRSIGDDGQPDVADDPERGRPPSRRVLRHGSMFGAVSSSAALARPTGTSRSAGAEPVLDRHPSRSPTNSTVVDGRALAGVRHPPLLEPRPSSPSNASTSRPRSSAAVRPPRAPRANRAELDVAHPASLPAARRRASARSRR